jgi:hypothetical protein
MCLGEVSLAGGTRHIFNCPACGSFYVGVWLYRTKLHFFAFVFLLSSSDSILCAMSTKLGSDQHLLGDTGLSLPLSSSTLLSRGQYLETGEPVKGVNTMMKTEPVMEPSPGYHNYLFNAQSFKNRRQLHQSPLLVCRRSLLGIA